MIAILFGSGSGFAQLCPRSYVYSFLSFCNHVYCCMVAHLLHSTQQHVVTSYGQPGNAVIAVSHVHQWQVFCSTVWLQPDSCLVCIICHLSQVLGVGHVVTFAFSCSIAVIILFVARYTFQSSWSKRSKDNIETWCVSVNSAKLIQLAGVAERQIFSSVAMSVLLYSVIIVVHKASGLAYM